MRLNDIQLNALREKLKHQCVGYPTCDGDLVATDHEPSCPAYGHSELEEHIFIGSNFLDTIDALKADLKLAESAVAGVYREAAKHQMHLHFSVGNGSIMAASCACGVRFNHTQPQCPQWEQHMLSLTPPAAIRAEKLLVAQAQKDILAKFADLEDRKTLTGDDVTSVVHAALEEIKKEQK